MPGKPLHQIIEDKKTAIVDLFVHKTREQDLPPCSLRPSELIDHLTTYLEELARVLRQGEIDRVDECVPAAEHGVQRWHLGYDLKSVIFEYGVLRDVILTVVEDAGHGITIKEFRDLSQFLNVGIAEAAVEFTDKSTHQITEALEEAKLATHAREEVVAIVSHELKDPLHVILGSLAMLMHDVAQPDLNANRASIERKLGAAQRSSQRMNTLITDLLDLARIRAGKLESDMRPERADDLLREAREQAQALAVERSVRLETQVLTTDTVVCDRPRVLQVFANLVGNAIKFSPRGGAVVLRVHCANDECTFEVRDQGDGIPAERLPNLFQRFWQAPETAPQGTGLGLAIAKGIVDQHSGRIWAESTVGKGTTFIFTLPRTGPGKSLAPDGVSRASSDPPDA